MKYLLFIFFTLNVYSDFDRNINEIKGKEFKFLNVSGTKKTSSKEQVSQIYAFEFDEKTILKYGVNSDNKIIQIVLYSKDKKDVDSESTKKMRERLESGQWTGLSSKTKLSPSLQFKNKLAFQGVSIFLKN